LHHIGSQEVTPVAVPEEPKEQPEVQEQEVPEAEEEVGEDLPECPTTARARSKEASPGAFSLPVCNYFINALL
jgi:hypothetical protein